jgi:hypothetical protein
MKKSTLTLIFTAIISISGLAQTEFNYGFRETYQNNVRTRSIDTVKITVDEANNQIVITEQVNGRVSVNCFAIVKQVLNNSIATQWTLRIQNTTADEPLAYLFLDKTGDRTLTYSCGYTIYVFDNDVTKSLGSKRLKSHGKHKKTDPNHYSFLNL